LKIADSAGSDLIELIAKGNKDEVSVEHIDRIADMLLSTDRDIREIAAAAVQLLGPSANRSARTIPALRRAIAEEIAMKHKSNTYRAGRSSLEGSAFSLEQRYRRTV
jgi:hypothetical protein